MTCRTSDVAVCCWRDSWSSLSRRVFSMAITACLAKLVTKSMCLSVNGSYFLAVDADNPHQIIFFYHRHAETRPIPPSRRL